MSGNTVDCDGCGRSTPLAGLEDVDGMMLCGACRVRYDRGRLRRQRKPEGRQPEPEEQEE